MPSFFILIFLSFLCLPGFAQEDIELEPISRGGGKVIIQGASEQGSAPIEVQPQVIHEDADVAELEAIREAQQKKIKMVEAAAEPLAKPLRNPLEEMKKLGYEQITAAALLDDKVLAILQRTLKERPVATLPIEKVKVMILENSKGSILADLFERFPRTLNFVVDFVRDEKALPGLLDILLRKDDLKSYGYIWLVIFIFGLYVKSRVIKPKWVFKKRFLYSLSFSLVLSSISLYLFYSLFSEEITPSLSVLVRNFL
jgi:hypothetical protein